MGAIKSFTDLNQSKKLAEFLPLESADMVLPFTHKENNEYVPGYAVSRNYIEAYNEMLLLPAMDKDTISKLIQPAWSLSALLDILTEQDFIIKTIGNEFNIDIPIRHCKIWFSSSLDAAFEMVCWLKENKKL